MTNATPKDGVSPPAETGAAAEGRPATLIVWVLFALSALTGGLAAVVGVVVAYAMRARATGLSRAHTDSQIALFWSGFIWTVLFTLAWLISLLLTTVFIGIPLLFVFWAALLLLGIWFTAKSVLGALALANGRAP